MATARDARNLRLRTGTGRSRVATIFAVALVGAVMAATFAGQARAGDPPPPPPDPTSPGAGCDWYGKLGMTIDSSNDNHGFGGNTETGRYAFSSAPVAGTEPCGAQWTYFHNDSWWASNACNFGGSDYTTETTEASSSGNGYTQTSLGGDGTGWYVDVSGYGGEVTFTKTSQSRNCEGVVTPGSFTWTDASWSLHTANADCPGEKTIAGPDVQAFSGACAYTEDTTGRTYTWSWNFRRVDCDQSIDSDGDALGDCREYALGTDPSDPDTDGDGLEDGDEVARGTDPLKPDTDGGGVPDGEEVNRGTNPLNPSDDTLAACEDKQSNDFDGLADWPSDPGCTGPADTSELGENDCDNGRDDDRDGMTDWPLDTTCESVLGVTECGGLVRDDVLGADEPDYVHPFLPLSRFTNDDAACSAVWVPRLDARFIPQGIAPDGKHVWVSGYFQGSAADVNVYCGVYKVNMETGSRGVGYLLPKGGCKHAGGVMLLADGRLLIADTRALYVLNPSAVEPGDKLRRINLYGSDFNGSFLVPDPNRYYLWIGTWNEFGQSWMRKFRVSRVLARLSTSLHKRENVATLRVPKKAQGAAFSSSTTVTVSSSNSTCGNLNNVNVNTGAVTKPRGFGPGVEEISFVGDRLWATFEAGTMRYPNKFFPVVAEFDRARIDSSTRCSL